MKKKFKVWPIILIVALLVVAAVSVFILKETDLKDIILADRLESVEEVEDYLKEQLDAGTYIIKVKADEDIVLAAANRIYDDPMYFWIDRNYLYVPGKGIQILTYAPAYSEDKVEAMKQAMSDAAFLIIGGIEKSASDYEKVMYVHDYLCENVAYMDDGTENSHNAYGALVNGYCVCEGYSEAFEYLLGLLDVETYTFTGNAQFPGSSTVPHSWNAAMIDGELYYFDITWDTYNEDKGGISYSYCGITSDEIVREHSADEYHTIIKTDATKYNYHIYNGYYIEEVTDEIFAEIVMKQPGNVVDFKCNNIITYTKLDSMISNPMMLASAWGLTGREGNYGGSAYVDEATRTIRFIFDYGE